MNDIRVRPLAQQTLNLFVILLIFEFHPGETDKAHLDTIKFEYDQSLVNISGGIDSKGILNFDYDLLKHLNTIHLHIISTYIKDNKKTVLIDKTLNLCKVFKMNAASPFILNIVSIAKKSSNISFLCPMVPGHYYTHGFNLKDLKLPPGRIFGIPKTIIFHGTVMRDKLKNEKADSENGKMFVGKVMAQVSLVS